MSDATNIVKVSSSAGLLTVKKAVNTNLSQAVERVVKMNVFDNSALALDALRELSEKIT